MRVASKGPGSGRPVNGMRATGAPLSSSSIRAPPLLFRRGWRWDGSHLSGERSTSSESMAMGLCAPETASESDPRRPRWALSAEGGVSDVLLLPVVRLSMAIGGALDTRTGAVMAVKGETGVGQRAAGAGVDGDGAIPGSSTLPGRVARMFLELISLKSGSGSGSRGASDNSDGLRSRFAAEGVGAIVAIPPGVTAVGEVGELLLLVLLL